MKKTIILSLFLFCSIFQTAMAQLEVTGSKDFGRIFDLTYDATVPNKVYAITLSNHIVVSYDNGNNWEVLYSLLIGKGAAIKDLKLLPDGSALTFYVHLPNSTINEVRVYDIASASIVKTFPLPNQGDMAYVRSYDFFNSNTDILLVDTNFPEGSGEAGKTYYTADGGATWNMVYYTTHNDTIFINNVAISPDNPQKLFLSRGLGSMGLSGGLYVSENAGNTWDEKLPNVVLGPLAFHPTNAQEIYLGTSIGFGSSDENLYKSTDGGATFSIVPITWTDGILDCINVIRYNKNNPSQIIVLEENEVVISEDGGNTWQNFVYPDELPDSYYYGLNASYNPQNDQEIFISANYVPLFSTDGGETLSWSKSRFFTSTGNIDLFNDATQQHLYYGVQFGYVHRDLNSEIDTAYDILPLNMMATSPGQTQYADKITPNRVYTFTSSFMGSSLKVSDDNGATKNELLMQYINYFTAVATFPTQPETILAAFAGFEPHETQLKLIDFSDINNVVVTDVTLPTVNYILEIIIDDANNIIMPIGNEVYISNNQGATWTNMSSGLEILDSSDLIFDLQKDPLNSNRMAVATSKGIFITDDGGINWVQKTTSVVNSVAFSTENEGAMVVSTNSSETTEFEMHYSTDFGETWNTITNEQLLGIGAVSSTYLFDNDVVKAFVGSFDLGLIEYTIDLNVAGIETFKDKFAVKLYPNPTAKLLNIETHKNEVAEVAIYSTTGVTVFKTETLTQIDVSHLTAGTYLVRIKLDDNNVLFSKFIKK